MKNIKNTKNYSKILILFFVFLFCFLFTINTEADWSYSATLTFAPSSTNSGNAPGLVTFKVDNNCDDTCAKNKCIAALNTWKEGDFYQKNESAFIIKECVSDKNNKSNGVVNVDPLKGAPASGVYKLLAPIGEFTEAPNNIGDYFNTIFKIAIGLCGVLAVIMIVIGGIQYMGDESIFGKTEAKSKIMSAILGLLIALGAWALLNTINPDLLGRKGVNIKKVSAAINEAPILSDVGKTIPIKNSFIDCPGGVRDVQVTGYPAAQHFIFCSAYASKLQLMFSDAYKATPRISLSGGAFRTYEEQLQSRRNNKCPNIYTSPASDCKPPTAIPGTSLHEQGLAIDLRCDGVLINFDDQNPGYTKTPATKKCWDWLDKNAKNYGFANLASENWHWSTGPNAGH